MMIPWYKQKTTWTALAGMITAAGGYLAGEIGVTALIGAIFAGLAAVFARQGIEKAKPQQTDDRGVSLE